MSSLADSEVRAFLSHGTRTGKIGWTASDGRPLIAPIWFLLDGEGDATEIVFMTGATAAKARAFARDPRAALAVDLEEPPFAFVQVQGAVTVTPYEDDPDGMLRISTAIAARYVGAEKADEFGRRNAVPGEVIVRLRPTKVVAAMDMTA